MKKIILNIIMAIIAPLAMIAQNTQNGLTRDLSSFMPLKSPNQQIIEKVVNSGAFIIKQSYELADSADNRYGLAGNKAFGVDYTLAIKVKNGFVVTDRTLHPWDYNSTYDQYRGKYTPKLFPTNFSEVASEARFDSILLDEQTIKPLSSELLYLVKSEEFFGDGFSFGGQYGKNEGWIIWFTKKKEQKLSKCTDLSLSIVKKEQTISESNTTCCYPIEPISTNEEIVGGIFVIPEVMSVGHLELRLCGMVCKIDNGWVLCCPFVKNDIAKEGKKAIETNDKQTTSNLELTPNVKESTKDTKSKSRNTKK